MSTVTVDIDEQRKMAEEKYRTTTQGLEEEKRQIESKLREAETHYHTVLSFLESLNGEKGSNVVAGSEEPKFSAAERVRQAVARIEHVEFDITMIREQLEALPQGDMSRSMIGRVVGYLIDAGELETVTAGAGRRATVFCKGSSYDTPDLYQEQELEQIGGAP